MKLRLLPMLTSMLLLSTPLTQSGVFAEDTAASTPVNAHALPAGIAWQSDVQAAFDQARVSNKPLFVYWGAVWCPPCNQVKATIFNQQAFIERTTAFIPVYIDGDSDGAQKWGEQFKVVGYPTMILFKPDGTEITRLPGEVDAERYVQALNLGLNATHPVKQLLASGLQPHAQLSLTEWQMLAAYSWDSSTELIPANQTAVTLQTLARHAAANHARTQALRLQLLAATSVVSTSVISHSKAPQPIDKPAALSALRIVLSDPHLTRDNFDLLVNFAPDLTELLTSSGTPARQQLLASANKAISTLAHDHNLSATDRLTAVNAEVGLAQLDLPKDAALPAPLVQTVRTAVAAADKTTTNGYERLSVVSAASDVLVSARLRDESDTLLKAELQRSHSPYYFMSGLASNAKARGDTAAALSWYEQAWNAADGPATHLRWGVTYLSNLIELAPQDDQRVQHVATSVIKDIGEQHNVFFEANQRNLQRLAQRLASWNKTGTHKATVDNVTGQLADICARLNGADPQHEKCVSLVNTARG